MDSVRLSERNSAMERELREADTDIISGIYNKNAFLRHAAQYLKAHPDGDYVLMRWDIDNFKIYNDMFGSEAGNSYLYRVGEYYKSHIAELTDTILYARYEADHFVCLKKAAAFDPEKSVQWLQLGLRADKKHLFDYSPRMGLYHIDDTSLDVALMCDRALLALKSIKNEYGKSYAWYENTMRDKLIHEHEIVNQMKSALDSGQFKVYFQPQYNYSAGTLTGAEALVRWIHPEKGVISPGEFIPIFENNGFIYELDRYVWEQTCAQMRSWKSRGVQMPPVSISVNISRKDLYQPDIVDQICALPKKYGVKPQELHLEITESAYIGNPELVTHVVSMLRSKGFRVEMDDFGSGYSSLNTLKNVSVDMLKLDMKFLAQDSADSKGGRILASVVRMAHEIDLPVIAEGGETKRQAEYLKSIGCHYMQGYYFSRPMPPEQFEKLLYSASIGEMEAPDRTIGVDGAADFMDANTQSTLLFNSFVGGAAILEYHAGEVAAIRLNDQFFETIGTDRQTYSRWQYDILDRFVAESRPVFIDALETAIKTGKESECEICSAPLEDNGPLLWTRCRLRCLTSRVESYLFYLSIDNINKRKQLEQRLENGKRELEELINAIPGGVATYHVRPDGFRLIYATDGVAALTGRTPEEYRQLWEECKGKNIIFPADEKKTMAAIMDAVKTGDEVDVNYRMLQKVGTPIWVNLRGRVSGMKDGYPQFYAVYHNLSASTELYQHILDQTDSALLVADRHTNELLYVNEEAARLAGRTKEESFGMRCNEYFNKLGGFCEYCKAERLADKPQEGEADYNGRHYHFRIMCIDWNGRDAYINYIVDRAEYWSRQKHSEEILNNIPGGIAVFRVEDGRILREAISEGAIAALGYEKDEEPLTEMLGANSRVHPEDIEKAKARIGEIANNGGLFDMDLRILPQSGIQRWVNLKAKPAPCDDGVLRYYGLYTDVTDRKYMEAELSISELEYRTAAEQSEVSVYRYYVDGRIGKFDNPVTDKYKRQPEIKNLPEHEVDAGTIAQESVDDWLAFFAAIDRGEPSGSTEVHVNAPEGCQRWYRLRFTCVSGSDGRPASAVISYKDVTDAREGRKSRAFEREGLITALSAVYPAVIACNITKNTYYTLKYAGPNRGFKERGSIDKLVERAAQMLPEDEKADFSAAFSRDRLLDTFKSGEKSVVRLEHGQYDEDGVLHWAEDVMMRVDNPYDGDVLALAISRDIDEQKLIEEKLKCALGIASEQLSRQQEYYKIINKYAPGLIAVRYLDKKEPVYIVGDLPNALGYSMAEVEHMLICSNMEMVHADDRAKLKPVVDSVKMQGPLEYREEFRAIKKDGGCCWLTGRGTRFVDENGKTGYIHIFTDITPRRRLLEDLKKNELIMSHVAEQSDRIFYYYDIAERKAYGLDSERCIANGLDDKYDSLNCKKAKLNVFKDSRDALHELFVKTENGEPTEGIKLHLKDTNGREKWFDLRGTPVYENGRFLNSAVMSLLDITDLHEREVVYARYLQTIGADHPDKAMYFETDLTANIVEKAGGALLKDAGRYEGGRHDDTVEALIKRAVKDKDALAEIRTVCSREHLMMLYGDGVTELEHDAPVDADAAAGMSWVRISAQMVGDPYTGHTRIFAQVQDITEQKERLLDAQRQAELDGMTGIYNHYAAERTINEALSTMGKRPCAFLLLDVDDLKYINDTYGHPEGDRALVSVAETLKKHFRRTDVIGRMGGDEFVVLLPGMADEDTFVPSLESLLSELANISVGEHDEHTIHCSIGCTFCDAELDGFSSIYRRADKALYHVKRASKNDYAMYTPEMQREDYVFARHSAAARGEGTSLTPGDITRLADAATASCQLALSANLTQDRYSIMESSAAVNALAAPTGSVEGLFNCQINSFHPDDRPVISAAMSREALLGAYAGGRSDVRLRVRRLDGETGKYRWVDIMAVLYENVTGDICDFMLARMSDEEQR